MVNEDYSSYEEYDLPVKSSASQMVKKDPIKKNVVNLITSST